MRFTIERMRTVVLAAGILLVGSLAAFLAVGKWRNPLNLKELPKRLGVDIEQEANGFDYTQSHGGRTLFKIHASKAIQLKDNHAELHNVKIELYGEDGNRVDRIEGDEFEYDQKAGTATAAGPVEITLMRPGVAPAIAPKAAAQVVEKAKTGGDKGQALKGKPLAAAKAAETGEIHVKTSGLTFDTKSRVATTSQHVDFSMVQGTGSSTGASYDSQHGHLVLDQSVQLNTQRGGETVLIHAQHAEFERGDYVCQMHAATADYRGGVATAGDAKILFRPNGSAVRLDAMNGFTLATATGGHIAAPTGSMDFNEHNQPRHGHLEGGVRMDSASQSESQNGMQSRQVHGTSPTAELEFTEQGELRHAHLERGVEMRSEELTEPANNKDVSLRVSRSWHSPVADVEFRAAGHGQVEPAKIHGTDGVVVTGESQRGNSAVVPSRLSADAVNGEFGPNSVLTAMTGTGHASMEETTVTGTRQTASGDRLEAHFAAAGATGQASGADGGAKASPAKNSGGAAQIQSAVLDGHVVLVQQQAAKPSGQINMPPSSQPTSQPAPMRATAGHAVYEGTGEWLHLTVNPRVEDGGLQLTADKVDVSQVSGDAFAHGNVKATWLDTSSGARSAGQAGHAGQTGQGSATLGGKGPAHVISAEAQLHQATGEATFRGHARLWQQANSVAGPVIVLDRQRQTLVARSTDPAEPVRAVLVSAGGPGSGSAAGVSTNSETGTASGKSTAPSVIRVRGGDLKYSDAERKAVMHGGALGTVVAETGTATSVSDEVEILLLPPGNHAGKDGGQAQVDRMTARGHVTVSSEGRHGTGEQLVYSSETGEYVLTGTAAAPPRMTDPTRGNTTGEALIFHSRDDSVSVEGGGRETTTETNAPK